MNMITAWSWLASRLGKRQQQQRRIITLVQLSLITFILLSIKRTYNDEALKDSFLKHFTFFLSNPALETSSEEESSASSSTTQHHQLLSVPPPPCSAETLRSAFNNEYNQPSRIPTLAINFNHSYTKEWINYGPSVGMVQTIELQTDDELCVVAVKEPPSSVEESGCQIPTHIRENKTSLITELLYCSSLSLELDFPLLVPIMGYLGEAEDDDNDDKEEECHLVHTAVFPVTTTFSYEPTSSKSTVRKDIPLRLARIALSIAEVLAEHSGKSGATTIQLPFILPLEILLHKEEHNISSFTAILTNILLDWLEVYMQQESSLYQSLHLVAADPKRLVEILRSAIADESRSFLSFILSPEVVKDPLQLHHSDSFQMLGSHLFDETKDLNFISRTHVLDNQTLPQRQYLYKQRAHVLYPTIADIIMNPADESLIVLAARSSKHPLRKRALSDLIISSNHPPENDDHLLRAKFSPSASGPWSEGIIELPSEISSFTEPSVYVETNGTVTMVLDTCQVRPGPLNTSCITIIQAQEGCTSSGCAPFEVMGMSNFLPMPRHCSQTPDDIFFDCPCLVEQPTIWFDKPMQKWRLLMHQYPSVSVNGTCVPQPDNFIFSGGYAETVGESVAGPWIYNFFQNAYNNVVRYDAGGERAIEILQYQHRERPRVILSPQGGLDGGYLATTLCSSTERDNDHDSDSRMQCEDQLQPVLKSSTTPDTRPSGILYLVTHGDTSPAIYPTGLSRKGIEHAKHMANYWSNSSRFDLPKTIIAGRTIDPYYRGQRLFGAMIPLSVRIGIDIIPGPLFKDDPKWTYRPDYEMLEMAILALGDGTTMVSFWCYIEEFCYLLGTECENFNKNQGEYHIFELEDGYVARHQFDTDGYAANFRLRQKGRKVKNSDWRELPSEIIETLSIIGFDEDSWDNDGERSNEKHWRELSDIEKKAALKLGFTEEVWNSEDAELETMIKEFYDPGWLIRED
jgi:hypothetical protein